MSYWLERKKGSKLKSEWKLADISNKPNSEQIKAECHKVFMETKAFSILLEQEPAQIVMQHPPRQRYILKEIEFSLKSNLYELYPYLFDTYMCCRFKEDLPDH